MKKKKHFNLLPTAPYFHFSQDWDDVQIGFNSEYVDLKTLKMCHKALGELIKNFSQEKVDEINGIKRELKPLDVHITE